MNLLPFCRAGSISQVFLSTNSESGNFQAYRIGTTFAKQAQKTVQFGQETAKLQNNLQEMFHIRYKVPCLELFENEINKFPKAVFAPKVFTKIMCTQIVLVKRTAFLQARFKSSNFPRVLKDFLSTNLEIWETVIFRHITQGHIWKIG